MRALVIDDSRAMRVILKRVLAELGIDSIEAGNGREGLDRLADAGPFELALVDWNLPEMNGFEFVRAVRSNPAWAELRLMMVTTETEREQVVRALSAGADEYVMKPFSKEALAEKIALLGLVQA